MICISSSTDISNLSVRVHVSNLTLEFVYIKISIQAIPFKRINAENLFLFGVFFFKHKRENMLAYTGQLVSYKLI